MTKDYNIWFIKSFFCDGYFIVFLIKLYQDFGGEDESEEKV